MWVMIRDFLKELDPALKAQFVTLVLKLIGLGRGRTAFNSTSEENDAKAECEQLGCDTRAIDEAMVQ